MIMSALCVALLQSALRGAAFKIIKARDIVLTGPLQLTISSQLTTFGLCFDFPIFIQNTTRQETFGGNLSCEYHAKFYGVGQIAVCGTQQVVTVFVQ